MMEMQRGNGSMEAAVMRKALGEKQGHEREKVG